MVNSDKGGENESGQEAPMILRVRLEGDRYDYVSSQAIDDLIEQNRILMFYRPSEKRWVDIGSDPIRKKRGVFYIGPERRTPPPADLLEQ